MKLLQINSVCGIRSTGRIATDIAKEYISNGHECRIAFGRESVPQEYQSISYRIGSDFSVNMNAFKARIFDDEGFHAKAATKRFLNWANDYNPDILWLHNLHGYYINIELLFEWIKSRPQMQVRWTLHDCWAFTGHCTHFSFVQCNRWRDGCEKCCQTKQYPKSLFWDASYKNFQRKKRIFCNVPNMTLITPSNWLANLVRQSFLGEYPIQVVHNTIDRSVFRPTPGNFREKVNLSHKRIVLGVATAWGERKGLHDFVELSKLLDDKYAIVLVGIDDRQVKAIPRSILCLPRTNSIQELAEIYTAADVFVNPSKEETFGLTTIEALACGTPVVVYQNTACEEIAQIYGGVAVPQSPQALMAAIEDLCEIKDDI